MTYNRTSQFYYIPIRICITPILLFFDPSKTREYRWELRPADSRADAVWLSSASGYCNRETVSSAQLI